ncbi:MAG: YqgE/AlgH family protein [Alphaproteobacteria bacterium]
MSKDIKIDLQALRGLRDGGYITGKMLIAMPHIEDARYKRSVILLYEHNKEGAKGFLLNRTTDRVSFLELARQLSIVCQNPPEPQLYHGGPIENMRGFVLHSADRQYRSSLKIADGIMMTSSIEPLNEIANRIGPSSRMILLGHSVWAKDELERELAENFWLVMECDLGICFQEDVHTKWLESMKKLKLNPAAISSMMGQS